MSNETILSLLQIIPLPGTGNCCSNHMTHFSVHGILYYKTTMLTVKPPK